MASPRPLRWLKLSALTLLGTLGCSSAETRDIGNDDVKMLGLELSDYAAQWNGYAEAFTFNDYTGMPNTDAIELTIDENGEGQLSVGNAPTMPEETDPNAAPRYITLGSGGGPGGYIDASNLVSGKDYPLYDAAVETRRLKLKVNPGYVYEDWCGLQTPVATNEPTIPYACVPALGGGGIDDTGECYVFDGQGGPQIPVSCAQFTGCVGNNLCSCTETECTPSEHRGIVELDAALSEDGNTLEGTLVQAGQRIIVRMTK